MSGENIIAIISKDGDFAAVVAEHARRELAVMVEVAETPEQIPVNTALVVTSETLRGEYVAPVLSVAGRAPLKLWELLAEIENLLQSGTASFGKDYVFSQVHRELTHVPSGKSAVLTDKEARLLLSLTSEGITREELLKTVWGMEPDINTHTLETHIYRLRAKFKELGDEHAIAVTENGYRLEV